MDIVLGASANANPSDDESVEKYRRTILILIFWIFFKFIIVKK